MKSKERWIKGVIGVARFWGNGVNSMHESFSLGKENFETSEKERFRRKLLRGQLRASIPVVSPS